MYGMADQELDKLAQRAKFKLDATGKKNGPTAKRDRSSYPLRTSLKSRKERGLLPIGVNTQAIIHPL